LNNCVLIGFKASGKTTVGEKLAEKLGIPFFDTDALVEAKCGTSCRDIVFDGGVEALNKEETGVVKELFEEADGVIATGGATPLNDDSRLLLEQWGTVVYLQASFDLVQERIETMPAYCKSEDELKQHFDDRSPYYQRIADRVVDVDGKALEDIVEEICHGEQ